MTETLALPGQNTLLACWKALAALSPGGRLTTLPGAMAAIFPASAYLNNAVLADGHDSAAAGAVASCLSRAYADAGVTSWAMWVTSVTPHFDPPDRLHQITGLTRDITTLVMHAILPGQLQRHCGVTRASIAAIERLAHDEPVPAAELGLPDPVPGLAAWAMLQGDVAVACAYTYLHGTDCGIYAVGTLPRWRRRGLARALVEHALADARDCGAETASLQSTPMGRSLYESLGFEAVGRYEEWLSPRRD